jgi:uncharacterized UPF0160 family protein
LEILENFKEQKRFFEFLRRNKIKRLRNYQATALKIVEEATNDILIYDRPITIKEKIEKIEAFSFRKTVEWIN